MTVSLFEGVDWQVVGLFLVLVLLEGLRRVPAGGLVIRRLGWSGWKPAEEPEPRTRWKLVSWWSPIAPALVLPPFTGSVQLSAAELADRLTIARRAAPWLATAGALTLIGLVLGVPLASARFGALGFFVAAGIVLALAITTALAGTWTLRQIRPGAPIDRRQLLGWCSPFASGRVLEGVYQGALVGASPAQAVRALAGEEVFGEWARPRAYDVVHGRSSDPDLVAAADLARLEAIIAAAPPMDSSAQSYCPRCAATWSVTRESCPDCEVAARLAGSD